MATPFSFVREYTPTGVNTTQFQIIAAANRDIELLAIELIPQGSTSATAPIKFVLKKATDGGAGVANTDGIIKGPRVVVAIATTFLIWSAAEAEPAYGPEPASLRHTFGCHQQSPRLWVPPEQVIIPGGERWSVVYKAGPLVLVGYQAYFRE
jgi:hypothetical protein